MYQLPLKRIRFSSLSTSQNHFQVFEKADTVLVHKKAILRIVIDWKQRKIEWHFNGMKQAECMFPKIMKAKEF